MAENAFIKIGTALLKHQIKKLVGEEVVGVLSTELAEIGGDKLEAWLGDQSTRAEIEKAANIARDTFHEKVGDVELEQYMHDLPLHNLPTVMEAIKALPTSPDETQLENALRETIALNWQRLSPAQVDHAVNAFLSCLRSALLPIEKQTLMVIGRAVLRTEDKVERVLKLVENLHTLTPGIRTPDTFLHTGWFFGHRYGDLATFTGRAAEFKMLDEWLENDRDNLLMLNAFGGFGKTALAWMWFNRVEREQWPTAVWWSFYEKESGFESFLSETLNHLGVEVKQSARQQVNDLLEAMRGTNILFVLDGFERLLRQYGRMDAALQSDDEDAEIDPSQRDCSSPLTETFLRGLSGAGMRSKVLMTTRLCPRVLESTDGKLLKGCREEVLSAMSKADAVEFFHKHAIQGRRDEIEAACELYGYHPLSLSLLVGLINADHTHRGDIAAVKSLEIFEDVKARRHHVLERAYESLAPERRDLLSKIACFRGSMEYATIKKVFDNPVLENSLIDLRQRGLLQYVEETKRYDLHPIVRRFAYDRLNAVDRAGVHARLVNYFEAIPKPQKVNTLEDLAPVIESYYHIARVGKFDEAATIYYKELQDRVYFQFNSHQLGIELLLILFPEGDDKLPHIDRSDKQAYILNELGRLYGRVGQPDKAILFYSAGNKVIGNTRLSMFNERANLETKISYANGMSGLASQERAIGNLTTAGNLLYHSINLCSEINDQLAQLLEAMHRSKLGHLLLYFGMWSVAFQELKKALEQLEILNHVQAQGVTWSDISFFYLLYDRSTIKKDSENIKFAIEASKQALKLADEDARTDSPTPRDYVRAYWLLGSAYRANNELTLAEENLSKALDLCRQINAVETEAEILLDVARLRYAQGDFKDAQEKASEALMITERSGYVLQRADVNLFLAQYALEQEQDKAKAKQYAETALKLAYCDGPPFYYKVAYEEAERMLEKLGSA